MWGGRCRRPQTCVAAIVRNEVLWTRHKFLRPPADDLGFRNTKDLVKADMTPMQKPSLMTSSVSGPQQQAPYFSLDAEGTGLPTADMAMMRVLEGCGHLHKAKETWKGCFVDVDYQLVLRFLEGCEALGHGQPSGWLFALYYYKGSSCIVLPVDLMELSGVVVGYQEIKFAKLKEPQLAYVYNLDHIECVCVCASGVAQLASASQEGSG